MPVSTETAARFPIAELRAMTDPTRTALLVIDVQRDFAAPDGAIGRLGLDLSAASAAIDRTETLVAGARSAGAPVVFARVISRPETDTPALRAFLRRTGRDPERAAAICRAGTPGADYYRVRPEADERQIEKTLFSCFFGTDLNDTLRSLGCDTLLLCGLTTDCCVDCTARDAFHHGFNVFLAADACAAYDTPTHEAALHGLSKNCAILLETGDVVQAWRQAGAQAGARADAA